MKNISVRMRIGLFVLFSCCMVVFSQAQITQKTIDKLPDTGQTKSYTDTYGEDSDYTINTPSLIDNHDGTITDKVTGLMWQKTDGGEMIYEHALSYADTMTLGGYTDWRLPSTLEAYSIMDLSVNNPALDINYFTKTLAEYWWTRDLQENDTNKVWVTNAGGGIGNHQKTETISAGGTKRYHARVVRSIGVKKILSKRFEIVNEDIVIDSFTDLMWQRKIIGIAMPWEDAIKYCEELNSEGYSDWRLPNIKELQSLHNTTKVMPGLDTDIFSDLGVKKLWSSTSQNNQATRAWYLDSNFGITTQDNKTSPFFVLSVRTNSIINSEIIPPSVDDQVKLFPNPASNEVYFSISDPIEMVIQDVLGNVLVKQLINENDNVVNISKFPNGILIFSFNNKAIKIIKY